MANTRFQKGHIMSQEVREKISNKLKGIKKSPETLNKMKLAQKGRLCTEKQKEKQRLSMTGRRASSETKLKMSVAQSGERGNKWKGGITPLVMNIRHHFKMRQWISDIFHRDDFTCQDCGNRGGKLNAHHLKSFSKIFNDNNIKTLEEALDCEEFWDLNNGQTLCLDCHKKINTRRDE